MITFIQLRSIRPGSVPVPTFLHPGTFDPFDGPSEPFSYSFTKIFVFQDY